MALRSDHVVVVRASGARAPNLRRLDRASRFTSPSSTCVLARSRGLDSPAGTLTRNGDSADIKEAQKALKHNGHDPGLIDGVIGPHTSAALMAYQKEQGLSVTGRLDDATLAKLEARSASDARLRSGSSGSQPTGDTRPSAVDPADAHKSGANVGEGASYNRSTEKGQSTMKGANQQK
jgi:peptidoglycan hydrolase-like protein with peptidoglycan-binding domain